MQLLLLLALLFVLEGVVFPLPGTLLFVRARGGFRARAPAGPLLLPLRPSRPAVLAAPAPFTVAEDGVRSRAPLARLDGERPGAPERTAPFAALARVTAVGGRVRVGDAPFLRALSRAHARALAERLGALGAVAPAGRAAWLRARADEDHEPAALRARVEAARAALRPAGLACDAYALALFAALPLAIAAFGEEPALLFGAAPLLACHLVAVVLSARAHRALFPEQRAERWETLVGAALFPPTLLRLPQRLFLAAAGVPPPIVATAALLDEPARSERLGQALAAAALPERAEPAPDAARVLAVAAAAGVPAERLRRARERRDPVAAGYCPVCLDDYLAGVDACAACGAPLVAYRE